MHSYGDEDFSDEMFNQVDDAAEFIGRNLRKWCRINVTQTKEKFGTARVYCYLGFSSFYNIFRPGYQWVPKWWPWTLDFTISHFIMPLINKIVIPIHISGYRYFYKQAIKKWPYLREEILEGADHYELLRGL